MPSHSHMAKTPADRAHSSGASWPASGSRYGRAYSDSPDRSSETVARLSRMRTSMLASALALSTSGREPVRSLSASQMPSLTFSSVKCVLRSSSFMPCARTAMLAPGAMTSCQGMRRMPSYSKLASPAFTRLTTSVTRDAKRDHRHTRWATAAVPKNATPPCSGRMRRPRRRLSSSARYCSNPARQLAKNSYSSYAGEVIWVPFVGGGSSFGRCAPEKKRGSCDPRFR